MSKKIVLFTGSGLNVKKAIKNKAAVIIPCDF
jgi:hypothetical protein